MLLLPSSALKQTIDDPRLARCGACGLANRCQSPRMPVTGEGRRGMLVVAEAPGKEEDKRNMQLVGPTGQTLRRYLRGLDVDLDRDCWKTNAVICCPRRNLTAEEVLACRPNLLKTVRELKPSTILLLGGPAITSLIGWLWREDPGNVGRWVGWRIPSQRLNAWVCPTYHPSYVMRTENAGERSRDNQQVQVISVMFREHLRRAFELEGRPWEKVPEYQKQVQIGIELDGAEAARTVRAVFCRSSVPVAFDFETNMLKPDSERAEIASCSMSNGEETIAFPMLPEIREALVEFLRSPVPKVAHNAKFDDRWSRAVLKTSVRNWHWCTMQTAHVLDNRRGVSGLKFQAFARLGQDSYSDLVAQYLKGTSNLPNNVRRLDARDLLLYNGLDSLLTWHLFRKQEEDLR